MQNCDSCYYDQHIRIGWAVGAIEFHLICNGKFISVTQNNQNKQNMRLSRGVNTAREEKKLRTT